MVHRINDAHDDHGASELLDLKNSIFLEALPATLEMPSRFFHSFDVNGTAWPALAGTSCRQRRATAATVPGQHRRPFVAPFTTW